MKQPKLIVGLHMLEKEDWISFRKYILMYCTQASDTFKLVSVLYAQKESLVKLESTEIIKKEFFNKMSVKGFSNLMSRIFNWFEEWLIWNEQKKDKTSSDIQLVKIYNRQGVYSLADKTYKRVKKILLNEDKLDLETNKSLYQLHHNHFVSDNPAKQRREEEILESLISYFLIQFKEQALLYITELHNWGIIQSHDYSKEVMLLTQIGELIDDSKVSHVVNLIKSLVVDLDKDSFLELKDVVISGQIKKGSDLYVLASLYMITFSMRLWSNNKISDPQIVLDTYDYGLDSGVLFSTGKMPIVRFMNLITALGRIKTSSKSYDFIDKCIHLVDTNQIESIQSLAYAQLKLIEGRYEDILPLLIGKKFDDENSKLNASALELISLYIDRKDSYSLLTNRLNNYKRVLKKYSIRGKSNTYKYQWNFAKVLELLIKRDFIKLTINIDNFSPIIFKQWLITEIEAGQK